MKVFMLGWEFPPHISGGLGTACHGLTKGLDGIGVRVTFVLPVSVSQAAASHVTFRSPADLRGSARGAMQTPQYPDKAFQTDAVTRAFEHVQMVRVPALLQPYATPESYEQTLRRLLDEQQDAIPAELREAILSGERTVEELAGEFEHMEPGTQPAGNGMFVRGAGANYGGDMMGQVNRYARLAVELARRDEFDVIHAHDWMTYPAAMAVSAATKKPLVVHIHSTEFDRCGDNVNQQVYDIERSGLHAADKVICVSMLTRNIVVSRYGVPPEKCEVVYNAVDLPAGQDLPVKPIRSDERLVLFLGRVTMQKGPEYFLMAARKVIEKFPSVRFVMAGSGDMILRCIEMAANLKIGSHVTFTGFLRGPDVDRVFKMADLYVMPSVSEPFGIAPLEALSRNVPVLISKQSGVSEVLTHALKVDFWDTDEMANKILAVLRHPPLQRTLRQHGTIEVEKFSWTDSARKVASVYTSVTSA